MSEHFVAASNWNNTTPEARAALKELIGDIVGYPCQLACIANEGIVDIYVKAADAVKDWIEIHPNGAIWPIMSMYTRLPAALGRRCQAYNEDHDVGLDSDSESDSDSDSDSDSISSSSNSEK